MQVIRGIFDSVDVINTVHPGALTIPVEAIGLSRGSSADLPTFWDLTSTLNSLGSQIKTCYYRPSLDILLPTFYGNDANLTEMDSRLHRFTPSPLLGARAEKVYDWFLRALDLPGDVAECGVFRGETSRELVRYLEESGSNKLAHLFDSFEGFPDLFTAEETSLAIGQEIGKGRYLCPLDVLRQEMGCLSHYVVHKGWFGETFPPFSQQLCFIHADADLYQSTVEIIRLADRCLVPGGHIVFDDYANMYFPGVKLAVDRHLNAASYTIIPSPETIQCFAIKE